MALPKLKSRGSYEDINGGAHRTAASIVGMPSLVRNLGIWDIRRDEGDETGRDGIAEGSPGSESSALEKPEGKEAARNQKRRTDYRDYIDDLKALISGRKNHLAEEPNGMPLGTYDQADSGAATLLRFRWHGMLTTIRLEYHTEYITLTSIIDLSIAAAGKCAGKLPDCPHYYVSAKIGAFSELFERGRIGHRLEHKEISDYLQLVIWDQFEREVLDAPREGRRILGRKFGEVFLDSRGIVTGTRSLDTKGKGKHALRAAFSYPEPRPRMRDDMRHDAPDAKWGSNTIQRLWPFIECEREIAEFEYTVTGFLKGRVLFVTALGPQPARDAEEADSETPAVPIRYFLHAWPDDEWQLGRLVDRINALGTMRLAATMEIGELRVAGGRMDDLAETIKQAATAIQTALKAEAEDSEDVSSSEVRKATALMGDIRKGYKAISARLATDIWHRLERSQYYFEQFQKECGGLREQRVEGFQTYSEFVTRRMNSIFGYLAYLRTRMESIDSANSSLERQYSWLKVATVTGEIRRVVERLTEQDGEIEKIQEFGEFALIGALIPYYLATAITATLALTGLAAGATWFGVILGCVIIGLVRIARQKRKIRRLPAGADDMKRAALNRLWWANLIFWLYFGAAIIAFAFLRPFIATDESGRSAPPGHHAAGPEPTH